MAQGWGRTKTESSFGQGFGVVANSFGIQKEELGEFRISHGNNYNCIEVPNHLNVAFPGIDISKDIPEFFGKSTLLHCVRVQYTLTSDKTRLHKLKELYPEMTSFKLSPKYFDLGFATAQDAEDAFSTNLYFGSHLVYKIRPIKDDEDCRFILIKSIPTTLTSKELESSLVSGLHNYGRIIGLHVSKNEIFNSLLEVPIYVILATNNNNNLHVPQISLLPLAPEEKIIVEDAVVPGCEYCCRFHTKSQKCEETHITLFWGR